MISLLRSLGRKSLALPAVLIVCLLPAAIHAETITIKNNTNIPIVVQATCVNARGQLVRDRPYKLAPGDSTPGIKLPGNKFINVSDINNPNKVHSHPVQAGTVDQNFEIVLDNTIPSKPRIKVELVMPPKK